MSFMKLFQNVWFNRLRTFWSDLISENQSAFITGQLISDNSIIACECIHYIQLLKEGDPDFCAYKLDLSKAYDRVDWDFLEQALLKWGFSQQWVAYVMTCVRSVKFSVKFNGKLLESFSPSRGLRQGDPLSPFLFLFVADALSGLVNKAMVEHGLEPVKICRRAPPISHLLFADDSLMFFRASAQHATVVKGLLNTHASSTGQLINPSKVKDILQVSQEVFDPKYLGLPVLDGRMHKGHF
jgi:hypothetical protein